VLRQLFALLILIALVGGGLYYWKLHPPGSHEDLGTITRRLEDAKVTASVRTALALNRSLRPYPIDVSTEEDVVTLHGEVPTEEAHAAALRIAAAVPSVRQVVDHVKVNPGATASASGDRTLGESLDDHSIEVQVKLALSLDKSLSGTDIKVEAFRKSVKLTGSVATPEQKSRAVELARETAEVAEVKDDLRVGGSTTRPPAADRKQAVEKALSANANLADAHIEVRESGGQLSLHGSVRSGAEKDLAGFVAREAANSDVDNALEVKH
jgi:osmotically-inducible protein OsmY